MARRTNPGYHGDLTIPGYKPKTPTVKKPGRGRTTPAVSPMGPYRAQSGNKKIRSRATPAERRKFSHGSTPTATRARKLERQDSRSAAPAKTTSSSSGSRPIETLRRAEAKLAKKPDPALRESARRLRHALASAALYKAARKTPEGTRESANLPERSLRTVAPRAYEKAREAAGAGGHGSSRGAGEPEDLTTAITVLAPGGGFAGAVGKKALEEGGAAVARDLAETAAGKLESTAGKVELKAAKAGSGVKAAGRLAGNAVRRIAGKETKKASESAAKAAAEKAIARGESKVASAGVPGLKLAKVAGGQALPVVRGHEEAIVHNPKAVVKRTAIGGAGLVISPVKGAIDVGTTGGRAVSQVAHEAGVPGAAGYSGKEILAPVKGLADEQIAFAKQVAKVVTASDSKYVQKEVEDNLGLMLPIVLGLGAKGVAEKLSKGRIVEGVRQIAEKARKEPLGEFRGRTARVLEKQGQHKTEARRVANAKLRAKRDEQAATGRYIHEARSAHGGEVVRRDVRPSRGRTARHTRKGLAQEEAKGALVVRPADVVPFATRHSIDLSDPAKAIAQVKTIRDSLKALPEGVTLPAGKLHTRDLLDYIERNADVLSHPRVRKALEERRKSGAYRREHAADLEPEHSERARYLPVATVKHEPFPEEMFPKDVRGIVRAKPERGVLAKDVLRKEAREDKGLGKKLRRKAATAAHRANVLRGELAVREKLNKTHLEQPLAPHQLRELKTVKELERRGQIPKGMAPVGGHLRLITPDEGKLPTKTLPKLHDRIRDRIDELDRSAVDLREKAVTVEEHGKAKHRASQGFDPSLEKEFVDREAAALRREGRPQPEYVHTGRAREAPGYGATGAKLTQFPGKSKFRKGSAEEYGMAEEGLVPDVRESFRRPAVRRESYKAMRGMLDDNEFKAGDKAEWSSDEIRELFDNKVLNRDQWVQVPAQLYNRAYRKFDPDVATAEMKMALDDQSPGTRFKLVRRPAAEEFFSQLSDALVSTKLVHINRATNFLILSTSPAWAAAQVVAEYTQGAIAQPKLLNPKWVKEAVKAYNAMSPHKRQAFDAWVGVTARELSRKEEMGFGKVEDAADAYSALHATPLGHLLTSIRDFDQWKGGRIRTLVTIAKADKELNGHLDGFVKGLGKLDEEMGKQLKAMKGKPLHEQLDYIADHPKLADRYQTYLDDVMGNWNALTKNERVASQLMIFYPFLRMSLRWTFYAFPKHHPIRAATLFYLSQQNATRVKQLLGGDPSFFTGWMKTPVNLGHGKVAWVPLSRIVPGANAPLEGLGGGVEGPKGTVALRTVQPVLGAGVTAATGVNPLTGKQEKGSGWSALEQLFPTTLSAPGRALNEALLPSGRKPAKGLGQSLPFLDTERQDDLDKLSAKLSGYGTASRYIRSLGAPVFPENGGLVRDKETLGRVIKALTKNSSTARGETNTAFATEMQDASLEGNHAQVHKLHKEREKRLTSMEAEYKEADGILDKLFARYGIAHEREDKAFLKFYDEGKYRNEGDSSNPWSAGASGGSSNPWSASSSGASSSNPWSSK